MSHLLGNEMGAKSLDNEIVLYEHIRKRGFQIGNGALPFMGEFVEYGRFSGKRFFNF